MIKGLTHKPIPWDEEPCPNCNQAYRWKMDAITGVDELLCFYPYT